MDAVSGQGCGGISCTVDRRVVDSLNANVDRSKVLNRAALVVIDGDCNRVGIRTPRVCGGMQVPQIGGIVQVGIQRVGGARQCDTGTAVAADRNARIFLVLGTQL